MIESDSDAAGQALEERFADQGLDATRTADRLAGYLVVENTYLSTFQRSVAGFVAGNSGPCRRDGA